MKITLLYLLFTILFNSAIIGQESVNFNCLALQKTIETKKFKEVFLNCEYKENKELIIIDTSNVFIDCSDMEVCGRKIIISHNWTKERAGNIIIVTRGVRKKGYFSFCFWCPLHGGSVNLDFKEKRQKVKLINSKSGDF